MLLPGAFWAHVLPKWPFWAHLLYSLFYTVSELRTACLRQARVAQAMLPPGALFHAGAFALPPRAPKSHMCPLPHLGLSDWWCHRLSRHFLTIFAFFCTAQGLSKSVKKFWIVLTVSDVFFVTFSRCLDSAAPLRGVLMFCYRDPTSWGRSNLVDPAEWPKTRLLNRDFGNMLSTFPRKNSKMRNSLYLFSPDPRDLQTLTWPGALGKLGNGCSYN